MQLSDLVLTVSGKNPSPFTLSGTNTFIVGSGRKRLLIDTGQGVEGYIEDLASAVEEIESIVITHFHRDHTGGIEDITKRWEGVKVYKYKIQGDDESIIHIKEGDVIQGEGFSLRVIETPGHSIDSISLFLEQENAIFTGDIVLGTGSTLLDDYTQYLHSMEKLINARAQFLYPAHGLAKVDASKLDLDLKHRKDRENQILSCLVGEMTDEEIMLRVYGEINQALRDPALKNTRLYLNHLKIQGCLSENNGKWFKNYAN